MVDEIKTLIIIIKERINEYDEIIRRLQTVNNSVLVIKKDEIEEFRKDKSKIIEIDMSVIEKVLDEVNTEEKSKEEILSYLNLIKTLLTLNKEHNTTFLIQDDQLQYIDKFFEEVDRLYEKNKLIQKNNMQSLGKISKLCGKYKSLLGLLEDDNSETFIDDLDLLNQIFDEVSLDDEERKRILLGIMKYNKRIVDKELNNEIIEVRIKRNNLEDLKELFSKYSYDFLSLTEEAQEDLLKFGNIDNMDEIFESLDNLSFPKFDLTDSDSQIKLLTILINCNKDVLNSIVNYSVQRGLQPKDLIKIIPVLIPQVSYSSSTRKKVSKNDGDNKLVLLGKSDDYVLNVEFFESIGFSLKDIYDKCKYLLVMPHAKIVSNYETFVEYGFSFDEDSDKHLTHPAFSCLISNNFKEIADQFIEVCEDGHNYIRQNMSRLSTISEADDIIFYNIYASYLTEDENGDKIDAEGPFVNRDSLYLRLRGEITRYNGSGYEEIPYRGVEESNKVRKTGTIKVRVENQSKFYAAVEKSKEEDFAIPDMISGDERLLALDEYIDERDSIRYNFNGRYISKLKVERIFNILKYYHLDNEEDALLYALTYNSIINEEDFNKIKGIISKKRRK